MLEVPQEEHEMNGQEVEQLLIQNYNMQMSIGFMVNSIDGPNLAFMEWENSKRAKASDLGANLFSKRNPDCIHVNT